MTPVEACAGDREKLAVLRSPPGARRTLATSSSPRAAGAAAKITTSSAGLADGASDHRDAGRRLVGRTSRRTHFDTRPICLDQTVHRASARLNVGTRSRASGRSARSSDAAGCRLAASRLRSNRSGGVSASRQDLEAGTQAQLTAAHARRIEARSYDPCGRDKQVLILSGTNGYLDQVPSATSGSY